MPYRALVEVMAVTLPPILLGLHLVVLLRLCALCVVLSTACARAESPAIRGEDAALDGRSTDDNLDGDIADPSPSAPHVVLAVADAADCRGPDTRVAELIDTLDGTILMAGDLAYREGSQSNFNECFLPLYGGDLDRIYAVPGDNDYGTGDPDTFFAILGDRTGAPGKGWFTADLGSWQLIGLNSECDAVGGCEAGSEQYEWLQNTLASTPDRACRIAMWHLPRFTSSANYSGIPRLGDLYSLLYEAGTDILLVGNSHHYERFAPLGPDGQPDAVGIANFTVGIGGASFTEFGAVLPGSVIRQNDTRGVVRFELSERRYDFEFVAADASTGFSDRGGTDCVTGGLATG